MPESSFVDDNGRETDVKLESGRVPVNGGFGGTTPDTNSGNKSAGTQRIVIATDQPQLTNPLKFEEQFSYSRKTADGQVKSSAGFLHSIAIAPVGTVVAGVLTVYDDPAETGTPVFSVALPVTTFTPFHVLLDVAMANGIYVGFDASLAQVQATVSYR